MKKIAEENMTETEKEDFLIAESEVIKDECGCLVRKIDGESQEIVEACEKCKKEIQRNRQEFWETQVFGSPSTLL